MRKITAVLKQTKKSRFAGLIETKKMAFFFLFAAALGRIQENTRWLGGLSDVDMENVLLSVI